MSLNELTIKEAIEGLREKKFSSVELISSCLDQIKKVDKELNAFITVCEKESIEQAKKADDLISNLTIEQFNNYPLLGIPVAFKDLFSTKGIRTTAGSKIIENYIPPFDATVVKKIKNAGAVVIGKTNLDAWAHGSSGENSDFGPARNPWRKEYTPGGSSSGSAACLSADLCIASTGTDTGGSIRLPASFCNVTGLKPTYGLVSRYGIIAMASSLDSIGHFTKTVEDSALFLNVTAGNDKLDASTTQRKLQDYTKRIGKGIKGLKIGVPDEYTVAEGGMEMDILMVYEECLKTFRNLGAEIVKISLPHTKYAIATYYIIQPSEVSSNLARYDGIRFGLDRKNFGDEAKRRIMLGTYTLSAGYYDAYYKKAMEVRTLIKNDFEESFKKVDTIITPVSPTTPWMIGEKIDDPLKMYLSDVFTVTANLAGIPGLSISGGFVNGFPVGIQILGPQFSEELLFQVGHAYEQETRWYKKKPELNF